MGNVGAASPRRRAVPIAPLDQLLAAWSEAHVARIVGDFAEGDVFGCDLSAAAAAALLGLDLPSATSLVASLAAKPGMAFGDEGAISAHALLAGIVCLHDATQAPARPPSSPAVAEGRGAEPKPVPPWHERLHRTISQLCDIFGSSNGLLTLDELAFMFITTSRAVKVRAATPTLEASWTHASSVSVRLFSTHGHRWFRAPTGPAALFRPRPSVPNPCTGVLGRRRRVARRRRSPSGGGCSANVPTDGCACAADVSLRAGGERSCAVPGQGKVVLRNRGRSGSRDK